MQHACYNTNLLGDPALSVWTETPKELTQPFEWQATGTEFKMKTPPYTWIALADYASGEIFTSQLTGYKPWDDTSFVLSDSTCLITDESYKQYVLNNQNIKVIIKTHNSLPYSTDLFLGVNISNSNSSFFNSQFKIISNKEIIKINFKLKSEEYITISIYNLKGSFLKTLANNKKLLSGNHTFNLNKNELPSGIFFCKLKASNAQCVKSFYIID
jgi:hypothetical protein